MNFGLFKKVSEREYSSDTGFSIKQMTGKIRSFYLNNDWVLLDNKSQLVDWDWNLKYLINRNKLTVIE